MWKRIRKSVKSKRDEEKFRRSQQELREWEEMEERGEIDMYYYDEAGFSLNPGVSYAWQEKGATIEVPTGRSVQINITGFLSKKKGLESFAFTGTITSDIVVECFNIFIKTLTKKTLIVIDNATIHTSEEFDNYIEEWEAEGLYLYYLPEYSPELNAIEILWRCIKYYWLPFSAYLSFSHLQSALEYILANYGSVYKILFA